MDTDEADEEAQDIGPAFDDNLDSDVVDFTMDRIFMTMVYPVDPHHFVHASSTVSRYLVVASAKNSKPKCFQGYCANIITCLC
jgi:hypothetical protein